MAEAFLAHLMQPMGRLLSHVPDGSNSDEPPKEVPRKSTIVSQPSSDLGLSNPWLKASASAALDLAQRSSDQVSSLPVASQLSSSLRGSAQVCHEHNPSSVPNLSLYKLLYLQALGAMCESISQAAVLLGISEKLILDRLKQLPGLSGAPKPHSVEFEELQKKLQRLSSRQEWRLEAEISRRHAAEHRASDLANGARVEISGLRQMLAEERRANSDLLVSLEALRSSGTDTSALKTFLESKVPSIQRAAYLEAKVCLLKKIREKYPDADMKYFADVKEIPEGGDLRPEWLEVPEGSFAYVSSLSAPPILLNKKRRLRHK